MREDVDAVRVRIGSRLKVERIEAERASRRPVDAGRDHEEVIAELVHRGECPIFRLGRFDD